MGATHQRRIHRETFGLLSLLGCITVCAAAAATGAVGNRSPETIIVSPRQGAVVSSAKPQDENVRFHPLSRFVSSLGHFESSVIRGRQTKLRKSQRMAVSGGLVAIAGLAVVFVVLQCARKALLPKLFGSLRKRALSNSGLEEQWIDNCGEKAEEEDSETEAAHSGPRQEEQPSQETGQSKALQALEDLRGLMTLGIQTVKHLDSERKAILIVLLLTLCTEELVLYGVFSTPGVELERQKTIDFILKQVRCALKTLDVGSQRANTLQRIEQNITLLEQFRSPPPESNQEELFVEASISACRISRCKEALQRLQFWVQSSVEIPSEVGEQTLKFLSYTRQAGKDRLKRNSATSAWLEAMQAKINYYGISEKIGRQKSSTSRLPLDREMRKLLSRYKRLEKRLSDSIIAALGHQPEQHLEQQRMQQEQRQQGDIQPLHEQGRHPSTQRSEDTIAPSSFLKPAGLPAILRTVLRAVPSHPSRSLPKVVQGTLPTRGTSLLNRPVFQSSSPNHPLPKLAPGWPKMPRQTKWQSPTDVFGVKSVLRPEAPVFTPRGTRYTEAHQHMPSTSSGAKDAWRPVPLSPGFPSSWKPASTSTGNLLRPVPLPRGFTSPHPTALRLRPPEVPPQPQREEVGPALPGLTPDFDNRTPLDSYWSLESPPGRPDSTPIRQRSEGSSRRFSRPSLQTPTPDIAESLLTLAYQFSGRQRRSTSELESPEPFWQPEGAGLQRGVSSETWDEMRRLNPILGLIADAFPTVETPSSAEAAQGRQGEDGLPRRSPLQAPASPDDSSTVSTGAASSIPVPRAPLDSDRKRQAYEHAAWSLRGDSGDGSK
ncbi:hypothetical protein EBH_0004960 [Eimeria brunetti]|uniref:Transmembrane protein n=1 Tax=Eimeria brunetti TaxID=51314 RepID=U6LRJ4_9EIME|nr:hypothetical protein EBH_0004960 [Eimeria brunetti]